MKYLQRMLAFLFLAFILQNCVKEEDALPQQVQFSVDLQLTDASGARISALPDGTMLRVSIQTGSGDPVLTDHSMELLSFGGGYMTEPIELNPGRYKIVDFFLVDGSQVLYATPKKGSPLAGAVVHPLEYGFNVGNNKVSNIAMEVVDANQRVPEDFGYLSFNIGIVNTFQLSVFTEEEEGKFSLASAKAHILNGTDTVRSFDLKNKVNLLSFQGDEDATYSLAVIKNGYARFTREFNITDLNVELDNKPLKLYLEPAFTMLAYSGRNAPHDFSIRLKGLSGSKLTVDWGDGSIDSYILGQGQTAGSNELAHTYPAEGNYSINITGDLQGITTFWSYYGQGPLDDIDLKHLSELVDFGLGLSRTPKTVDFTHNLKLEYINLSGSYELENIYLSTSHNIRSLDISGPYGESQITTTVVDSIISNMYDNAIKNNIRERSINLHRIWSNVGTPLTEMVGPPSEEALVKLRYLRDSYGWGIAPNP